MFTKIWAWFAWRISGVTPKTVGRKEHSISRKNISPQALKVLYRLKEAGFHAYLVGGGVRDLLLGQHPKDFDVATDARPEQVYRLFRNCRLIGRRFRLAHVYFPEGIIEVATFRKSASNGNNTNNSGVLLSDNEYGTLQDDVFRRDFTINALYYNIGDFSVIDYVGGIKDLKQKVIRLVGSPEVRYKEDPVRMLRAIRFAAKLNFTIEGNTSRYINKFAHFLQHVSPARLFEEFQKLFLSGVAVKTLELLRTYGLLPYFLPKLTVSLLVEHSIKLLDKRNTSKREENLIFLLSAIFFESFTTQTEQQSVHEAFNQISNVAFLGIMVPRRIMLLVKDTWLLQQRLVDRRKKVQYVSRHPAFPRAVELLKIRAATIEPHLLDTVKWWDEFLQATDEEQKKMLRHSGPYKKRSRKSHKIVK